MATGNKVEVGVGVGYSGKPLWQKLGLKGEGEGIRIFRNAVDYARG